MRVPRSLQGIVCKKELRYSLQTADLPEARYRAIKMARGMERIFEELMKNEAYRKEMTKER